MIISSGSLSVNGLSKACSALYDTSLEFGILLIVTFLPYYAAKA